MSEQLSNKESFRTPRIVGLDDSSIEKEVAQSVREFLRDVPPSNIHFREHGPKIEQLIGELNASLKVFFAEYGIKLVDFPSSRILLASGDEEGIQDYIVRRESGSVLGEYVAHGNFIFMLPRSLLVSPLHFASLLAHELIHANAITSFTQVEDSESIFRVVVSDDNGTPKRIPMGVHRTSLLIAKEMSNGKPLFFDINEALTTELQIRYMQQHVRDLHSIEPEKIEATLMKAVLEGRVMNVDVEKIDDGLEAKAYPYPYREQRKKFNDIIDELYQKNHDKFASREDVFKLFVDAAYTGQLLPLSRLVEQTRGKGSFRAMGENLSKDNVSAKTDSK